MKILALALALCCAPVRTRAAGHEAPPWELEVALYAWVPGTYGTIDVGSRTAHLDVTPGDLLEAVFDGDALAAAAYFSVGHERWSAFADVFGGGQKEDVAETVPGAAPLGNVSVKAEDTMRFVIADFAVGYELGRWTLPRRRSPLRLGVYAGARYVHLANALRASVAGGGRRFGGTVSEADDWVDPMIGVRWSVPLLDAVSSTFRGDIGGFGASSELDWGIAFDVRYWTDWHPCSTQPYLAAGYRLVAFDRSPSGRKADVQMRGPTLGMGLTF